MPNYQVRSSANKPHGCPMQLPFTRCLEQDVSFNCCLTILPRTLLSRPGRCPSQGTPCHSKSLLAPPSLHLAVRVTPPTDLISVGRAPLQASKAPLWRLERQKGERETGGEGFTSQHPQHPQHLVSRLPDLFYPLWSSIACWLNQVLSLSCSPASSPLWPPVWSASRAQLAQNFL